MQWLGMERPDWQKMLLTLLGLVAATLALISAMLLRRYRPPRKDAAAVLYARFLRKAGQVAAIGETPSAYAARLDAADPATGPAAQRVATCYLAARYGSAGGKDLDLLRRAVDEFPRRAMQRLRLRG